MRKALWCTLMAAPFYGAGCASHEVREVSPRLDDEGQRPLVSVTPQSSVKKLSLVTEDPIDDESPRGLGIDRERVTESLEEYFRLEPFRARDDGRDWYWSRLDYDGQDPKGAKLVGNLEVIGTEGDVHETTLMFRLDASRKDPEVCEHYARLTRQFMRNTCPHWADAEDWALSTLKASTATGESAFEVQGDRTIEVGLNRDFAYIKIGPVASL